MTLSALGLPVIKITRKMPQDGSHLRAKSGITDHDLEWSLAGYAELYDTSLGHIGHSWEREEFDLDFKGINRSVILIIWLLGSRTPHVIRC